MKVVGIISKIVIILALIAMCFVIIFVQAPQETTDGDLVFDVTTRPDFANTLTSVDPSNLPTDADDVIALAYSMYETANSNIKSTDKVTFMVNCHTNMLINLGVTKLEMPVYGSRYITKVGTEYYYTEYSIPGGGLGMLAGMVAKENTVFAIRSYADSTIMDYMYSEKSYEPEFTTDENGEQVIICDWSEGNMVSQDKWATEQKLPVYNSTQSGNYVQTDQVINENTIKSATIEYNKTKEGNYYTITLVLDVDNPETTEISIVNLRNGAGSDAHYLDMVETIEIWENGYFKRFRSVDTWEAGGGFMSSVLDYDTYFYYDDEHTDVANYDNYAEVKQNAIAYNQNR